MKKRLYIVLAIFTIAGCDFLEVEQFGKNDIEKFFSDMDGLRAAVPGMYRAFYEFYDENYLKYPEAAGDLLNLAPTSSNMADQFNFTSDPEQETGAVGYIWRNGFNAMVNTNNILTYAPGLLSKFPADKKEIEGIMGDALFIRALCHFCICNCYAQPYTFTSDASHLGIPVLTRVPSANETILRNSVKEVYQRIISDLEEALTYFGNTAVTDVFYASSTACNAFLARVYLYMGDWKEAIKYADKVTAVTSLSSRSEYIALFQNGGAGAEAIFRVNGYQITSRKLRDFYDVASSGAYPSLKLTSLFEDPNDIRLALLYSGNRPECRKYITPGEADDELKPYAPFVFRTSEMYLIRAESYCKLNEPENAANNLKAIMGRALGIQSEEVEIQYKNVTELERLVATERMKELCFEGHRFLDIIRKKENLERDAQTTSSVRFLAYPNDKFVLPIPQIEMEANAGIQPNPGVN